MPWETLRDPERNWRTMENHSAELKFWLVAELLRKQLEKSSSVARVEEQESVVQWFERIWT